ncbi:hypothetical protein EIQ18_05965 [Xanthomonas campestris pv. campestris]
MQRQPANPESRIPNPESRIPNPESRIANRESRIPIPHSPFPIPHSPFPQPWPGARSALRSNVKLTRSGPTDRYRFVSGWQT